MKPLAHAVPLVLAALVAVAPRVSAQTDVAKPGAPPVAADSLRASMLASDSILVTRVEVLEYPAGDTVGAPHKFANKRMSVNQVKHAWMQRLAANFVPAGTETRGELCTPPPTTDPNHRPWLLSALWVNKGGARGQLYVNLASGCGMAGLAGSRPGSIDITAHRDSLLALFQQALYADTVLARETMSAILDSAKAHAPHEVKETMPEAITKVSPTYPDSARKAKIEGTVMVKALVGKDGGVMRVEIERGVTGLDASALAAVKQWKFKPATADGQPRAVWVIVPVMFRLAADEPKLHH